MDFDRVIRKRRSIRKFTDKNIGDETVKNILQMAILAPSAGNLQSWQFIIIRNKQRKNQLAEAALEQYWIERAPVIVAIIADKNRSASRYGDRGSELYCIQDSAAAIQNMLLTITNMGLGACWVGAFREELVSNILNLPPDMRPIALLPIGHPSFDPIMPQRRPLDTVTRYETWG